VSDSLLQTLSSCRTEYFGRLGMVTVSFWVKPGSGSAGAARPLHPQEKQTSSCRHGMSASCINQVARSSGRMGAHNKAQERQLLNPPGLLNEPVDPEGSQVLL
jgi:hypothetical protein